MFLPSTPELIAIIRSNPELEQQLQARVIARAERVLFRACTELSQLGLHSIVQHLDNAADECRRLENRTTLLDVEEYAYRKHLSEAR